MSRLHGERQRVQQLTEARELEHVFKDRTIIHKSEFPQSSVGEQMRILQRGYVFGIMEMCQLLSVGWNDFDNIKIPSYS